MTTWHCARCATTYFERPDDGLCDECLQHLTEENMDKDAELDHIKNSPKFSVCDRVTYADINLRHYSGIVTSIGQTKNGGNCLESESC